MTVSQSSFPASVATSLPPASSKLCRRAKYACRRHSTVKIQIAITILSLKALGDITVWWVQMTEQKACAS